MTKLTQKEKLQIIQKIEDKKIALGSYSAVAAFCKKSDAVINQMRQGKYVTKSDDAWMEVGTLLGWKPEGANNKHLWQLAETTDYKSIRKVLNDAKYNSIFLPIADFAGIGKSTSLKMYADENANNNVYYLRSMEWGKREFLENLLRTLGIDTGRGYHPPNTYIQLIIDFFQARSIQQPLLIIDEADKLKSSSIGTLIPIYNECEDALGVVIAGTENLEKEIKKGVKFSKKGYDELDSRFGRKYIKLIGCTLNETQKICAANGIDDEELVKDFFEQCGPVRKELTVQKQKIFVRVITDLRRLKRLVIKHKLKEQLN